MAIVRIAQSGLVLLLLCASAASAIAVIDGQRSVPAKLVSFQADAPEDAEAPQKTEPVAAAEGLAEKASNVDAADATASEPRRETYEDWREAGPGPYGLGRQLRSQVVLLDENGGLTGRLGLIDPESGSLVSASDVNVIFVHRRRVIATSAPNEAGEFRVEGLSPGVYSVIADGPAGFCCFSVDVRREDLADEETPSVRKIDKSPYKFVLFQEATRVLDMETAIVPPRDYRTVVGLMRYWMPRSVSRLPPRPRPGGIRFPTGSPPLIDPAVPRGTAINHHAVRLQPDGRLHGRIRHLNSGSGKNLRLREMNVFMIQGDQVVAQEPVAVNGTFAFRELTPGIYSMVAAGRDGFLAFSVDVAPANSVDAVQDDADDAEVPVQAVSYQAETTDAQAADAADTAEVTTAAEAATATEAATTTEAANANAAEAANAEAAQGGDVGGAPGSAGGIDGCLCPWSDVSAAFGPGPGMAGRGLGGMGGFGGGGFGGGGFGAGGGGLLGGGLLDALLLGGAIAGGIALLDDDDNGQSSPFDPDP